MSVPAHERLLDLIIALTQSRSAMTRAQIRAHVNGYSDDDGDPRSTASFERMFERDKELLKELGVPLETIHRSGHSDDIWYRINVDEYQLPDVALTPAELGVLSVATHLWDGSVLARQARRGLTKIKGVTPHSAEGVPTPAVRLHEPDAQLPTLIEAISDRRPVEFTYRAASTGQETERRVEPWQLTVKDQGWYLRAWDLDRNSGREYRLSRITSAVRVLDTSFVGPEPQAAAQEDPILTRLLIRPDAAGLIRARGRLVRSHPEADEIEVPVADLTSFAGDIAALAGGVVALDPPELRALVHHKLQTLAQLPAEEGA